MFFSAALFVRQERSEQEILPRMAQPPTFFARFSNIYAGEENFIIFFSCRLIWQPSLKVGRLKSLVW